MHVFTQHPWANGKSRLEVLWFHFLPESESELESLPKELELESHGINSLLESIPVAESIPVVESIPLLESIPPHRGSYSSVECG